VTLLLAEASTSDKYKAAVSLQKTIVRPSWVTDTFTQGVVVSSDAHRVHFLAGSYVCITGFSADDRAEIKTLVERYGGTYSPDLDSKLCTHLLASVPQGKKYDHAIAHRLPVASKQWLLDSVEAQETLSLTPYAVVRDSPTPHRTLQTADGNTEHTPDKGPRSTSRAPSSTRTGNHSHGNGGVVRRERERVSTPTLNDLDSVVADPSNDR
jgi:hypothetical protein